MIASYTEASAIDVPLELRCASSQDREDWRPLVPGGLEYATPEDALFMTLADTDLRPEGFHHFAEQPAGAIAPNVFVQFLDGQPVTLVFVEGGILGFQLSAQWCVGNPDGWVPDPTPPG